MSIEINSDDNIDYYLNACKESSDPIRNVTGQILKQIIDSYDMNEYRKLEQRYIAGDYNRLVLGNDDCKFLNLPYWLHNKAVMAHYCMMRQSGPISILDIGSGAGHFMLIARMLGHKVHGLDIRHELYDDLFTFFDLPKTHHTILAKQLMPNFGQKFDLVTAYYANFNTDHFAHDLPSRGETAWDEDKWDYFLTDLVQNVVKENGAIEFMLNPLEDAKHGLRHGNNSLIPYFESIGAEIKHRDLRIVRLENFDHFRK